MGAVRMAIMNQSDSTVDQQRVRSVAQDLSEADLIQFCSGIFPDEPLYQRFANEARFGLSRVLPVLSSFDTAQLDVLEVGAGSCILAAYLASKNMRMTALEPLGPEFGFFTDLQNRTLDFCRRKSIPLDLIRKTGEQLDVRSRFDVAFTINALEHMRDPLLAIDNMVASLRSGGVLLAHCPNYTVPFDSHFNVLLLTRSKPINEWLYRSKIARHPSVWKELNLIRYIDVRRHLDARGLTGTFNTSAMRDSVARLLDDPLFAQRMPLPVRAIGGILRSTGLARALRLMPARFQSPMEMLVKKPDRGPRDRTSP